MLRLNNSAFAGLGVADVDDYRFVKLPWWWPWPDPRWQEEAPNFLEPDPCPWLAQHIARQLSLKDAALRGKKGALVEGMDRALEHFIDGCGTKWWRWPGPFPPRHIGPLPGDDEPRPILYEIAAELNLMANSLSEGSLKASFLKTADLLIQKADAR